MVLTCIKTVRLAFDVCTFECLNCDNIDEVMIEIRREFPFSRRDGSTQTR